MRRRRFLRLACVGGAWLLFSGHSPYRHWDVYRKARLVVLVSASEPGAVSLAGALARVYAKLLPESRATYARARDTNDLVRLIASRQLEIALMREADALAVLNGERPFADNGKVPLRALAPVGDFLLVGRAELPEASAYMLAEALAEHREEIADTTANAPRPRPDPELRVPLHPGAARYYREHEPRN